VHKPLFEIIDEKYKIKEFNHSEFRKFFADNTHLFNNDTSNNFKDYYLDHSESDHSQLYTLSYELYYDNIFIGYLSLSNVHMSSEPLGTGYIHNYIPSVYLQYFAIFKDFRGKGHGSYFISMLKEHLVFNSLSSCRFIIADSLLQSKDFYEKNGFNELSDDHTRPRELILECETTRYYFDLYDLI